MNTEESEVFKNVFNHLILHNDDDFEIPEEIFGERLQRLISIDSDHSHSEPIAYSYSSPPAKKAVIEERTESSSGKHVMLSYQHAFKEDVMKIRTKLIDSGYRVWMDVFDMGSNLIDSMYFAIKNSAVFIMCMSKSYEDSQNCRSEAVFARKKLEMDDIVPIIVEKGYKLNGWLEFVVEDRLYLKFSDDDEFYMKLISRLGDRGKN